MTLLPFKSVINCVKKHSFATFKCAYFSQVIHRLTDVFCCMLLYQVFKHGWIWPIRIQDRISFRDFFRNLFHIQWVKWNWIWNFSLSWENLLGKLDTPNHSLSLWTIFQENSVRRHPSFTKLPKRNARWKTQMELLVSATVGKNNMH